MEFVKLRHPKQIYSTTLMGCAGGRNGSIYYASGIRSKTFEISRIEGGRHIQNYLALTERIIPKAIHTSQLANLLQSMHYFDKDFLLFGLLMCLASYFFSRSRYISGRVDFCLRSRSKKLNKMGVSKIICLRLRFAYTCDHFLKSF